MGEELRAYFFQNMYLQGIHAGIQSQHTTVEMFRKYTKLRESRSRIAELDYDMLVDWADNYKTTIVLNGGYAVNLERIKTLFQSQDNPYPWASFNESAEALSGCITNVGIVVPEKVFGLRQRLSATAEANAKGLTYFPMEQCYEGMSEFDKLLAEELGKCRLMT